MYQASRIALAAEIIGVRVYSTNLDRPTEVTFQVAAATLSAAYAAAEGAARRLIAAGFSQVTTSTAGRGAGTWSHAQVTVEVGQ